MENDGKECVVELQDKFNEIEQYLEKVKVYINDHLRQGNTVINKRALYKKIDALEKVSHRLKDNLMKSK